MRGWLHVAAGWWWTKPSWMQRRSTACAHTHLPGLVVLRSVGKFFGMAGARAGFVCAHATLLEALREQLGPWTLAGPTRWAVQQALMDTHWQTQARARLYGASQRLAALLTTHGLLPAAGTAFFQWCRRDDAPALHTALAQRGILTRLFETPASLRFGLPPDAAGEARLAAALQELQA